MGFIPEAYNIHTTYCPMRLDMCEYVELSSSITHNILFIDETNNGPITSITHKLSVRYTGVTTFKIDTISVPISDGLTAYAKLFKKHREQIDRNKLAFLLSNNLIANYGDIGTGFSIDESMTLDKLEEVIKPYFSCKHYKSDVGFIAKNHDKLLMFMLFCKYIDGEIPMTRILELIYPPKQEMVQLNG